MREKKLKEIKKLRMQNMYGELKKQAAENAK